MCPIGLSTAIPVIVSQAAAALPYIWLGGGEVDVKLRIPVSQLVSLPNTPVIDCTAPRMLSGSGTDDDGL